MYLGVLWFELLSYQLGQTLHRIYTRRHYSTREERIHAGTIAYASDLQSLESTILTDPDWIEISLEP